jgi:hypothetical protein
MKNRARIAAISLPLVGGSSPTAPSPGASTPQSHASHPGVSPTVRFSALGLSDFRLLDGWRPESGVKGTGAVPVMVMLSGSGDILGAVVVPGPDL